MSNKVLVDTRGAIIKIALPECIYIERCGGRVAMCLSVEGHLTGEENDQ